MYLIIDNYDSFTYNLYQYLRELTEIPVRVARNDEITLGGITEMNPAGIIISPGPGRPEEAGIIIDAVREFAGKIPILGVCLGHQAIGYAFGARIIGAKRIVHGKTEPIITDGRGLFRAIPNPAVFVRYHSLVVEESSLPPSLEVTARSADGEVMGIRHREYLLEGVQFHPESAGSEGGKTLLKNFLHYRREAFEPKRSLTGIMAKKHMSRGEAENFMEELTEGNLSPAQIAAFLVALNAKGVTGEEIAGCAAVLQRKRKPVHADMPVLDTCGTGGDGFGTFNISSFAALIASSAGVAVAKHGNRAISSKSGSADFFKALGVPVELNGPQAEESLRKHRFAFLFAPLFHGAMRHAAPVRKDIGIKTIMNLLGPLVNPAGAQFQLIGVYDETFCRPMAEAAALLGVKRAYVVHGLDGLDEISVAAPTKIVRLEEDGSISEGLFDPESLGIRGYSSEELLGSDAEGNAALAMDLARGEGSAALRHAVLLNAGAALAIYGTAGDLSEGYGIAEKYLASGAVLEKIEALRGTPLAATGDGG
jgi:anthranilate synthase/phosphoribosyltransferase